MSWYKEILHLFTKLSDRSFWNIVDGGTFRKALINLVASTIILYLVTYLSPFVVADVISVTGVKFLKGLPQFDGITALASVSFLVVQVVLGGCILWRLLDLVGGRGSYKGVVQNYIYGLSYMNALRTLIIVLIHLIGVVLYTLSWRRYIVDVAYFITTFSQYYAVFIAAQIMRRYVNLGIAKTFLVMFIVTALSISVLQHWNQWLHTVLK
ncbi:hypothetical protein VEHSUH05_00895 [Veillonella denticariosi JCM 15641]|uniref:Yip1 domain n=2 Tax=Veillonella TaxID=29465 RepID=A0A239YCR5_9FIRM|nr:MULTISPECIES: hypothetical protein [Veillonella]PQL21011.1 hypothetical protein VEHSUH05_00895 [Veillonella denticariosi JCM 15641]SNV57051.1 Uncharacterised protein [Veillonella rodentium]